MTKKALEIMVENYEIIETRLRNSLERAEKELVAERKKRRVLGQYVVDPYGELDAFECYECGATKAIVYDAKAEQPNYCHGCGGKFDWEGVYERLLDEKYKEIEE